ncbi:thioredoxin H1-like [Cucurbita pepo subsp. pepo]|uniref:thioredoxin H1-like n=1 Tax=Cucurbita pepo subsp. pepo TaxID=3664 RepID=UPI000C9D8EB7|nr:thioredoxin H1-like [Cucurbita pepo subsp. pepo]XP_023525274.1 thioredoxin H1-like [Cucurbita pepo subsp. pepo]
MAGKGEVIACHTVGSWKQQILKGKQSNKLIVVDFTAAWCGPCRAMAPVFAELAKKMSNVIFLKVDVDELMAVAAEWGVSALPCFMFLKNGKVVDRFVGARKDQLQKIVLQNA